MRSGCPMHDVPDQDRLGTLYIVATPIGNLKDITLRALDVLREADIIAAEDTRHTRKLLSHYQIRSHLVSCHEHNESFRIPMLLEKLGSGQSVALVTDAGTPAVSDPGYRLVLAAISRGIVVVPVPGPCAAMAALCASGLPSDAFYFAGFLPAASSKRRAKLTEMSRIAATLIFYESPRRVTAALEDMAAVLGDRPGVIAREMTKIHERFLRGRLMELIHILQSKEILKGEVTILVGPSEENLQNNPWQLEADILSALQQKGAGTSELAKHFSKMYNLPRHAVYEKILEIKTTMTQQTPLQKGDSADE